MPLTHSIEVSVLFTLSASARASPLVVSRLLFLRLQVRSKSAVDLSCTRTKAPHSLDESQRAVHLERVRQGLAANWAKGVLM